ncbi:Wnt inhibitory factor 1 [Operophtera brumata]|uniref:Wnt inhibitory factor 1 n=1 Tax=Operophtera brumata TaxID=104452 RepID=A0A0L7L7X5_OPEBR|nr:Wnt inhibitory factor 1 [Operophtera brumata]
MSLTLGAGRREYRDPEGKQQDISMWIDERQVRMFSGDRREYRDPEGKQQDISMWINERQVRMFSGISMQVFAIANGHVSPYVLDPNFSLKLPIIPSEVGYVNFTWRSKKKYFYNFDTLTSSDLKVLKPPVLSIKTQGRVPKTPKEFSIVLPCVGNSSGIATLEIGLVLKNGRNLPLKGTPLRLNLKKECAQRGVYFERTGPDPECDKKCANQGWCNHEKICQCPDGYMGQHCRTALCYPQCMNGGNCTAPGVCSCPAGYQGRNCEGAKCVIPCLAGGRCKGVNKCRCPAGLGGNHCEVGRRGGECVRACRHGRCVGGGCICEPGWRGRFCHRSTGDYLYLSEHHDLSASFSNQLFFFILLTYF